MIIRGALEADAQQIAAVHVVSWRFAYRGALSDEFLAGDIISERSTFWANRLYSAPLNQYVIVAENEDQIIGFACVYTNIDEQWGNLLDNLHVEQSMQQQGIGSKLLGAAALWCLSNNAPDGLFVWVLQSNLQAQRFYQNLGAINSGSDIWIPPGGGHVPRYRYSWQSVSYLLQQLKTRVRATAYGYSRA